MEIHDEYAICPYCGETHGDCHEWLTNIEPKEFECQSCGKTYLAWAEFSTQYNTQKWDQPKEI